MQDRPGAYPTPADTSFCWRCRWCIFIVIFVIMIGLQLWLQWFWLLLYAALIIPFAPWQSIPMRFYRYDAPLLPASLM